MPQIQILNRFTDAVPIKTFQIRKGSPRAVHDVRAKVVHTARQGRRIELFLTGPVLQKMGWRHGGRVSVFVGTASLILRPSHFGLLLSRFNSRTETVRLCIHGDFIRQSACAPVRSLDYETDPDESVIAVKLPREWIQACAAEQVAS